MRAEVGIECPVRASLMGRELHEMQADFEYALAHLSGHYRLKLRNLAPRPSVDELVKIVQFSFFKLVDPSGLVNKLPDDKGWFSGHPFEWEQHWQQTNKPKDQPVSQLTGIMHAFLNLFGLKNNDGLNTAHGFPIKKLPFFKTDIHKNDLEYYNDDDKEDDEDDADPYDYQDED